MIDIATFPSATVITKQGDDTGPAAVVWQPGGHGYWTTLYPTRRDYVLHCNGESVEHVFYSAALQHAIELMGG